MASETPMPPREPNAVDDVRRVRERLSAEFGGDVRRLAEHAQRIAEQRQRSLKLKPVPPPVVTK